MDTGLDDDVPTAEQIRAAIRAQRSQRTADERDADDRARNRRVVKLISHLLSGRSSTVVACYLSAGDEPGTHDLLDALTRTHRVLAPKLGHYDDGTARRDPDWAWFEGADHLVTGVFGIPDPDGPGLGQAALAEADLTIAAGLCAGADGSRIGTGGGWYDRALLYRNPSSPIIILLNDDEIRAVPQEPHDQKVDWIVTPTRTVKTSSV